MSKIYLSRSISRTLSADHPVGDPTGGAAYGEKNDPVSAILSVASMAGTYGAAAAAAGAGAGIGATFSAMTIMQGLTFAGGALSLVGNVTGNKTLSKVGMAAGIVGGLGQMGAFGEGVKGAKWGDSFSSTIDDSAVNYSSASKGTAPTQGTAPLKGSQAAGNLTEDVAAQTKITEANMAARGGNVSGASGQPGASFQTNAFDPANQSYLKGPTNFSKPDYSFGSGVDGVSPAGGVGLKVGAGPAVAPQLNANAPGILDKLKQGQYWEATKDIASGLNPITNPYGAMAVGQIAQPIADYLSGKTDAEIEALEAQTRANEATAGYTDERTQQLKEEIAREKRRRENLNAGYGQINTGINVNPAVLGQAQAGGLIAQQMQPAT